MVKKFKKISFLVLATFMMTLFYSWAPVNAATGVRIMNIIHTNDTHSRTGLAAKDKTYPFAKLKTYVDSLGKEDTLLLDAGDTYHGQAFATLKNGSTVAKLLKAIGYDAMAPGNHDFNYGYERLLELEQESGVPVFATNVYKNEKKLFQKNEFVFTKGGIKVGVFGLATPETAYKTNPNNVLGVNFGNDETLVRDAENSIKVLKEQGAEVIVALTHLGIDPETTFKSTDLAQTVKGIDLIIDGHSHSKASDYAKFNETSETKITSTGQYLESFGQVTVTIDETGKKNINITSKDANTIASEDQTMKTLLDDLNKDINIIKGQVVGNTPIELIGDRSIVRWGHSNLGILISDAMRAETGATIALTNGGGIRASINTGEITKGEIIDVLPFGNFIITKEVLGADIIAALEFGMEEGAGKFTHFSGINVTSEIISYTDDKGNVIRRHRIIDATVNGQKIELGKKYVIATNDFMAVGGDGYEMFKKYPTLKEYSSLDEALLKYISVDGESKIKVADETKTIQLDVVSGNEKIKKAENAGNRVEIVKTEKETIGKVYDKNGRLIDKIYIRNVETSNYDTAKDVISNSTSTKVEINELGALIVTVVGPDNKVTELYLEDVIAVEVQDSIYIVDEAIANGHGVKVENFLNGLLIEIQDVTRGIETLKLYIDGISLKDKAHFEKLVKENLVAGNEVIVSDIYEGISVAILDKDGNLIEEMYLTDVTKEEANNYIENVKKEISESQKPTNPTEPTQPTNPGQTGNQTNPQTGDNTNPLVLVTMMGLCAVAFVIARKREKIS